jgi:hypothetical protein
MNPQFEPQAPFHPFGSGSCSSMHAIFFNNGEMAVKWQTAQWYD